ncbi:MAG: hypothetical protein CMF96_04600 [Candidatus Marinimicrobia bacterium]|nr:hypothetical protein [Candidatus Neomarinimicrobiota bacterium]
MKYKLKIPKLLKYIIIFILKTFNRYLGSLFYLIFAENSYLKLYPKLDSKRFQTILNFPIIDVFNNFKLSNRKNNKDLFYIGAITPERGFYEMISALDILYKKNIELKLHLVGPNWYNLKIPKSFMHLENNVIFYGRMDIRDGYHYSKNALLGLSLLHPIENYLESYPTKIFEYMACSLPVITSNFDLYKTIVEKNKCGYCVDPMNPLEIANAIEKFIINPVIAQEFGSNGNLLVQHKYNWVIEEDKLIKFYKRII